MRKLTHLLLLLAVATPTFADPPDEDVLRPHVEGPSQTWIQVNPGINFSLLDGNPQYRGNFQNASTAQQNIDFLSSATGLSALFDIEYGYELTPRFGLSGRLAYDRRSVSRTESMNEYVDAVFNDVPVEKSYTIAATYFSIAVLGRAKFKNLFLFLGPTLSIPVGQELTEENHIVDANSPVFYHSGRTGETKSITASITSDSANVLATRFSVKVGAGYVFELSDGLMLVPQLAYDFPLTNLTKENSQQYDYFFLVTNDQFAQNKPKVGTKLNEKMRMSTFQLTIGVRVNL